MPTLRVIETGQRKAFDIIDAPDYAIRQTATAVFVRFHDLCEEGRLRTYANDPRPFGPTIRHFRNISERFIDQLHLVVGREYPAAFSILQDGSHQYGLLNIEG